jgi:hypothetical protein
MAKIYVPAHTRADGTKVKGHYRTIEEGEKVVIRKSYGGGVGKVVGMSEMSSDFVTVKFLGKKKSKGKAYFHTGSLRRLSDVISRKKMKR